MIRTILAAGTLLALAAAAPAAAQTGGIVVEKPWARASVGTSRPTAAFMVIANRSATPDRLVAASTPSAGLVELHRTTIKNGMAHMMKMEAIPVPAGGSVTLAPGGLHIMLMKLKAPVVKGTKIPLTLTFERAGTVTVEAMVMGPGSGGHQHRH